MKVKQNSTKVNFYQNSKQKISLNLSNNQSNVKNLTKQTNKSRINVQSTNQNEKHATQILHQRVNKIKAAKTLFLLHKYQKKSFKKHKSIENQFQQNHQISSEQKNLHNYQQIIKKNQNINNSNFTNFTNKAIPHKILIFQKQIKNININKHANNYSSEKKKLTILHHQQNRFVNTLQSNVKPNQPYKLRKNSQNNKFSPQNKFKKFQTSMVSSIKNSPINNLSKKQKFYQFLNQTSSIFYPQQAQKSKIAKTIQVIKQKDNKQYQYTKKSNPANPVITHHESFSSKKNYFNHLKQSKPFFNFVQNMPKSKTFKRRSKTQQVLPQNQALLSIKKLNYDNIYNSQFQDQSCSNNLSSVYKFYERIRDHTNKTTLCSHTKFQENQNFKSNAYDDFDYLKQQIILYGGKNGSNNKNTHEKYNQKRKKFNISPWNEKLQ